MPHPVAEWAEWSAPSPLRRPRLSPPHPVFSASYFLMTKCLRETIGVDFSLNPGYSVGSLHGSGTQRFRRLTKQAPFTSAPTAACYAFHTQEKDQRADGWPINEPAYSNAGSGVTLRSAFRYICTRGCVPARPSGRWIVWQFRVSVTCICSFIKHIVCKSCYLL